jgi:hypothetical protein
MRHSHCEAISSNVEYLVAPGTRGNHSQEEP